MTEGLAALGPQQEKPARPTYRYTIPSRIGSDVRKVGLVQLTSNEELMATKRSRNDTARLAYELAKQALVEVDGERVGVADGSVDKAWDRLLPKVRTLVMSAYAELHAPQEEDVSDFLQSQQVQV